jgi:hypothetical protein
MPCHWPRPLPCPGTAMALRSSRPRSPGSVLIAVSGGEMAKSAREGRLRYGIRGPRSRMPRFFSCALLVPFVSGNRGTGPDGARP